MRDLILPLWLGLWPLVLLAAEPLDPYTTIIPTHTLPAGAAADGKLDEWAGVPAVSADSFKTLANNQRITPSPGFAPTVRCGRVPGSPDLFFLVVIEDDQRWSNDSGGWAAPDCLELYLDFGRAARAAQDVNWYKTNNWPNAREMGQFGFRPGTLTSTPRAFTAVNAGKWKFDWIAVPVEGGQAYEVRIDGASVLADLQMKELPPVIGFDLGPADQDYPVTLSAGEWNTQPVYYRLFGDGMNHVHPVKYGTLSLDPQPADPQAPPPRVLPVLYGEAPTESELLAALRKLPDAQMADLVYWAGLKGTKLNETFVKALFAARAPRAQEKCLAVLFVKSKDETVIRPAVAGTYKNAARATPMGLVFANLLNRDRELGFREPLRRLLSHDDLAVAVTAGQALAAIGTVADTGYFEQECAALEAAVAQSSADNSPDAQPQRARAFACADSLEILQARTVPLPEPRSVSRREVLKENTDLPRHLPVDNNKVYNAAALRREWPKEGPPVLWRADVGDGLATAVEAGGRAFTAGILEDKLHALCFNPQTGELLWKRALTEKGGDASVTPVADGDRVYYVMPAVVCLNASNGEQLWAENNAYRGTSYSSPLVVGEVLYVGASHPSALVAVEKLTGKLLWSTPPGRTSSPNSPVWQEIDGVPQIILGAAIGNNKPEVWGIDARSGAIFWKRPFNVTYGLCSSPVVDGPKIYLCGGHGPQWSECVQAFVRDGKTRTRLVYRKDRIQNNSHNTPVIFDGAVYGFGPDGLQCTSLQDGTVYWQQKWSDSRRHLFVADGRLFVSTGQGEIVVAEATREAYRELGRWPTGIDLGGDTQQMTLANGRLYVRGKGKLACFDVRAIQP